MKRSPSFPFIAMDFVDILHGTWLFYAYPFFKGVGSGLGEMKRSEDEVGETGKTGSKMTVWRLTFFPVLVDVVGTWSSLLLVCSWRVPAYKYSAGN